MQNLVRAAVLGVLACGLPRAAEAQSNYRLAPVGGRSALLGGTGVVYGRDAAAAFLNPATAVLADDDRLSFSANFYTVSFVYAPRWYAPGPVDAERFGSLGLPSRSLYDLEFKALPSSLCVIFRAGQVKLLARDIKDPQMRSARLGVCFATVQEQSFDFAAEGIGGVGPERVTRQAQSLSQSFTRFAAGPTYAMNVSSALAIGASLHATLASHRSLLTAATSTYGGGAPPFSTGFYAGSRGDAFQLEPLLGATYRIGQRQKVGLSLKLPSIHVFGVGGANRETRFGGADESASSLVSASGSFVSRSPLRVSLGTGIERGWGNAELNVGVSLPTTAYSAELEGDGVDITGNEATPRAFKATLSERARGVVNVAVGAEVFVSPRVGILGGLSTDVSAVRGVPRGSLFNYFPSSHNRVGASFGVGTHGEGGELLFGGEVAVGWGERLAVSSYELPPTIGTTGHGTYQLMLVVAGSTSLKTITRAVKDVREVLTDPKKANKPGPATPRPGPKAGPAAAPKEPPPPNPSTPPPDLPPESVRDAQPDGTDTKGPDAGAAPGP